MIADEPIPDPAPRVKRTNAPGAGRPFVEINLDTVRQAAGIGCTYDEIATVLNIHRATFYRHLADDPEVKEALEAGRAKGRATLRRHQWARAEAGSDTMLIWLGKNMLGQSDKLEQTGPNGGPLVTETVYRWAKPDEAAEDDTTG